MNNQKNEALRKRALAIQHTTGSGVYRVGYLMDFIEEWEKLQKIFLTKRKKSGWLGFTNRRHIEEEMSK